MIGRLSFEMSDPNLERRQPQSQIMVEELSSYQEIWPNSRCFVLTDLDSRAAFELYFLNENWLRLRYSTRFTSFDLERQAHDIDQTIVYGLLGESRTFAPQQLRDFHVYCDYSQVSKRNNELLNMNDEGDNWQYFLVHDMYGDQLDFILYYHKLIHTLQVNPQRQRPELTLDYSTADFIVGYGHEEVPEDELGMMVDIGNSMNAPIWMTIEARRGNKNRLFSPELLLYVMRQHKDADYIHPQLAKALSHELHELTSSD